MSIENGMPQIELPPDYPDDMSLRMQDQDILINMHTMAEAAVPTFGWQQIGLRLVMTAAFESESLTTAIDLGASVYAAATGVVMNTDEYEGEAAQFFALQGVREFERDIGSDDEKLLELLKKARGRMETDAPRLTEVIEEVVGRYYHDKGLRDMARFGAGAMRGLHILMNKRLISSAFDENEADAFLGE